MVRSEGDSWDIVTSVGHTALAVAAGRALDARLDPPLAHDDHAAAFVAAAGAPELAAAVAAGDMTSSAAFNAQWVGVRTRFFDNFFADAAGAGVRQQVILAAGLDSRAYRLPWPAITTVFELDQPKVLQFKEEVLRRSGAQPSARRVPVAVDLREDWPAALRVAGFDAGQPTGWILEGLLPYLPGAAQDALFERLNVLSAPGSWVAAELGPEPGELDRLASSIKTAVDDTSDGGTQPNLRDLWFDDPRADTKAWLGGHGWTVTPANLVEAAITYGRPLHDLPQAFETFLSTKFFTAVRDHPRG
ncbi:SAM-dependent methyltransferase [Mycobacteroides immunogenum]|uniref:S-adenosyl-L-methionine-dependent methyltransferase n=1 Tax=Mycobacteroides immunogenum TaxID=83262 RepID=A0A7V8LTN8_9MYCO|nr:SAM-dependent methyltransferase [Mycobacteroides immunogenum]AMT73140.1 SAM-dependent methyltransferase [Mycobacteroides immunogenum]ANO06299.1 SAM-dependent methyltransferase [Mycobacteroides immunogenum]KIU41721.1 SAM-dependent methyltransferase [Mycobacteroides immunogenum]KPG11536.1 SAM-dependent methyltransferase [Mycobacteroides immunogenum]KPG11977.1 SAM-dependent methyltransferase [Mycobacteroides immunogenum]